MVGAKKKRKVEASWWDRHSSASAPTSTLLSISHDQQRLRQQTRRIDLTQDANPGLQDINDDEDIYSDYTQSSDYVYAEERWDGDEADEYTRFWEALNESGITEDAILQTLNKAEEAQAAQVDLKTTRKANIYTDNPNLAWIPFREEYLDELLYMEGRGESSTVCWVCEVEEARFRCVDEDCLQGGMMCDSCIVDAHQRLPLHWIEEWNGSFFTGTSLKALGLKVYLGHPAGKRCHYSTSADHDFTVIHVNGIHNVAVEFCACRGDDSPKHATQLLRAQWYPATPRNPQTALTFSCLRQFHHINCLGKLPAFDYYGAIKLMTRSRQRKQPKDRYKVFLRSMFQWRHLKMCKRSGRGHHHLHISGTTEGELALPCPACPQEGWNLPRNWQDVPKSLAFKYFQFLAIDANFRLRNKIVSDEYRSPTLGPGWAYMVPQEAYKNYIEGFVHEKEMSSCSGFAAMFLANLKNVKGLRVTGVGGVCCGRHRVWRANGIGDLQKGERYCNMDFIFWSTIKGKQYLTIVVSYDISCQWSRQFWMRMHCLDPSIEMKYGLEGIIFLIPKFHLRAHRPACHSDYNFNYTPGCGETHGEVIEEGWSQSNKAASQTKEMGPGTRAMTLDDVFGFSNWQTIQNLDQVIGKRLINAVKEFDSHFIDFRKFDEALESKLGRGELDKWKDMIETWEADHSESCPYEVQVTGRQSFKQAQVDLAKEEHERIMRGEVVHSSSLCVFVATGIELQESQRSLSLYLLTNKPLSPTQELEVQKRRGSLLKRIQHFRSIQKLLMPRLEDALLLLETGAKCKTGITLTDHLNKPNASEPERIRLFLPSDLPTLSLRNLACVGNLPDDEARLREAEARDTLESVRDGLRVRTMCTRYKIRNVRGQRNNTRAGGVLRTIDIRIHANKIRYRCARAALETLDKDGLWSETLLPLEDRDVRGLNERSLTKEEAAERDARRQRGLGADDDEVDIEPGIVAMVQGEGQRTLSWIWYDPTVSSDDPAFKDAIRVEWCKARARMLRWKEEVILLVEEIRRMREYSQTKATWWEARQVGKAEMRAGGSLSVELVEGLDAYALQQAAFERERADHIQSRWRLLADHAEKVLDRIPDLGVLVVDWDDLEEDTEKDDDDV
ncbi:hypothetical protein VKT23_020364 [Stygiomarasmius scandens]|uniref:CxC2-like cysteine cluster KDZ transposase-associated domain-containing protein n=1 Tax=Marasmiellus scandens TaxID=2682957 RepID=A0ABR1IJ82_9AGAR